MRIAVICTAYIGNPAGIALLAEYFSALDAYIYVHVDKKADIGPYLKLTTSFGNVHFVEDRFEYFWGGFNGSRAVISALRLASQQFGYDRYIYITEDTVPLIQGSRVLSLFDKNIEYFDVQQTDVEWVRRRYDSFFFYDCRQLNPRLFHQEDKVITPKFLDSIDILKRFIKHGKLQLRDIYHGAAYFALSGRAIAELLEVYERNVHLRTSFEFSAIPEEQYFQTVLGSSATEYEFRPFILMDMSGEPSPFIYHTAGELERLKRHGFPFARKVALGIPEIEDFVRRLIDGPGLR